MFFFFFILINHLHMLNRKIPYLSPIRLVCSCVCVYYVFVKLYRDFFHVWIFWCVNDGVAIAHITAIQNERRWREKEREKKMLYWDLDCVIFNKSHRLRHRFTVSFCRILKKIGINTKRKKIHFECVKIEAVLSFFCLFYICCLNEWFICNKISTQWNQKLVFSLSLSYI